MKKTIAAILFIAALMSFISCGRERDAYEMLSEFISAYGAEGVIYSPKVPEGDDGYIRDGFIEKVYVFSGRFPDNYAIFLNSRPDFSSECGFFICPDAEMLGMVEEMCLERIRLLAQGDNRAFVRRSGSAVFYSTMQDRERAEKIFSEIIR